MDDMDESETMMDRADFDFASGKKSAIGHGSTICRFGISFCSKCEIIPSARE